MNAVKIIVLTGSLMVACASAQQSAECKSEEVAPVAIKSCVGFAFNEPMPRNLKYDEGGLGIETQVNNIQYGDLPGEARMFLRQFDDFMFARARVLTNSHELISLSLKFGDGGRITLQNYDDSPSEEERYRKRAAEIAAAFEKHLGVRFRKESGRDCWRVGNGENGASVDLGITDMPSKPSASRPLRYRLVPSINVDVWDRRKVHQLEREKEWAAFAVRPQIAKGSRATSLTGVFGHDFGEKVVSDDYNDNGSVVKVVELESSVEGFKNIVLFGTPISLALYKVRAGRDSVNEEGFTNCVAFLSSSFGVPRTKNRESAIWEIASAEGRTNELDQVEISLNWLQDKKMMILDFTHKEWALRASLEEIVAPDRTFGIIPESAKGVAPRQIKGVMGFRFGDNVRKYEYDRTSQALVATFTESGSASKALLDGFDQIKMFGSKDTGECFMIRVCFDCDSSLDALIAVKKLKAKLERALGLKMKCDEDEDWLGDVSNIAVSIGRKDSIVLLDFIDMPRYERSIKE